MKQSITIKINAWIICAVLLIANLVTLGFWQLWVDNSASDRTIVITGSTTIEAEADQFVFSPYYQKEGADKTVINTELSDLAATITVKLKELGVEDSAIKTDVNSYEYSIYYGVDTSAETSNLYLTVTIKDKTLAQRVQDYIVTTSPTGSITPQISFSTAKQKTLETQARDAALTDARSKAEASAKQLGASLGKVVTVTDNTYGGVTPMPWMMDAGTKSSDSSISSGAESSYSIQPGLNEYSFSVVVTYELK
jgi:uncharacterized protein YggE